MALLSLPSGTSLRAGELLSEPGSTSAVYRGRLSYFGDVAIKIINRDGLGDRGTWDSWKYQNEVQCARLLAHQPGIREVVDHFALVACLPRAVQAPYGAWVLIYDYVEATLREMLQAHGGRLPARMVRELVSTVGRSLTLVHKAGVIHRDLKPENILVVRGNVGDTRLADFGVSLHPGNRADRHARALVGSFGYQAPEVRLRPEGATAASDLYSLASLAWECLTGQLPDLASPYGTTATANGNELAAVLTVGRRRRPALTRCLRQALARTPRARQKSVAAFVDAFITAGARDGLWPPPARITPAVRKKRHRRTVSWEVMDYRPVGGALWFYGPNAGRVILEKASPGVRWSFHEGRGGFWTKDASAKATTILKRAGS